MQRFKGVLQYDGTAYRGWQRQADTPTVQQTCERAVSAVLDRDIGVVAAGRSDTGVHARAQVVHFDHDARILPAVLRRAWNAYLPDDIRVTRLRAVHADFHARFDAIARTYRYYVGVGPGARSPFVSRYHWPIERPLDWPAIQRATRALVGTHDFRQFAKGVPPSSDAIPNPGICVVTAAEWRRGRRGRYLEITGNRFLRHMARAITGSLIDVGRGRTSPTDLARAITAAGRPPGSAHAPPRGLFLWNVAYPA